MKSRPSKTKSIQTEHPKWTRWAGWALAIFSGFLYLQTVAYDFVLDDQVVYSENSFVQKGVSGIPDILLNEGFVGYFGERRSLVVGDRYRPLSLVTFAVEHQIVGNKPWLGHLINSLLYGLLVFLIFGLIRNWVKEWKEKDLIWIAIVITGLFALHPTHVEAVANIKGRDEILAALFMILALRTVRPASESLSFWKTSWMLPIFVFLAAMSKEHGLTLLALVPMTQILVYKHSWKKILQGFILVGLGIAAYFGMRYMALGQIIPSAAAVTGDLMNNPFLEMDENQTWATIMYTWLRYLGLLLFPHPLTHDYYPYHIDIKEWSDISVIFSSLVYIVLGILAAFSWKKRPWLTWSIGAFVLTLLPASNMFFTVGTFMNERFLFFPSLGFAIAIGMVVGSGVYASKSWIRTIAFVFLGTWFLGYAARTVTRIPAWKSGATLNQAAIKVSGNSARINLFVGTDYFNEAQAIQNRQEKKVLLEKARKHLEKSVRIYPMYGSGNNMLSGTCAEQFKLDNNAKKLLQCFEQIATFRPDTEYLNQFLDFLKGRGDYIPELIDYYTRVGYNRLYMERSNFPASLQYLREANELNPGSRDLYQKLSAVYLAFAAHLQKYPDPKYPTTEIIESGRYFGNKAQGL